MYVCILVFVIFHLLCWNAASTPQGAGGCEGGKSAVGGPHLSAVSSIESLNLTEGGVKVKLGGELLSESVTTLVSADTKYEIRVEAAEFLGVLIRLEAPAGAKTIAALVPGTNTHMAFACSLPVVGITHFDNSVKSFANGTIVFEDNWKGVTIDITVVFSVFVVSRFAYGRFVLDFFGSPTSAPAIPVPTFRPTVAPQVEDDDIIENPARQVRPMEPTLRPRRPMKKTPAPTKRPTRRPNRKMMTMAPTKRPIRRPRTQPRR